MTLALPFAAFTGTHGQLWSVAARDRSGAPKACAETRRLALQSQLTPLDQPEGRTAFAFGGPSNKAFWSRRWQLYRGQRCARCPGASMFRVTVARQYAQQVRARMVADV